MSRGIQITKFVFAVLLLFAFAAAFFVNRWHYSHLAGSLLASEIERRTGYKTSIERISGNFWNRLVLDEIALSKTGGDRFDAARVVLLFSWGELLDNPPHLLGIHLSRPEYLSGQSDSTETREGPLAFALPSLPFIADELVIDDGQVAFGTRTLRGIGLLSSLERRDDRSVVTLDSLGFIWAETVSALLTQWQGEISWRDAAPGSLLVDASIGASQLAIRGAVQTDPAVDGNLVIEARQLAIGELTAMLGVDAGDDPGGLTGTIQVSGGPDNFTLLWSGNYQGNGYDVAVDALRGRWRENAFELDDLTAGTRGARLKGRGKFPLGEREPLRFNLDFSNVAIERFVEQEDAGLSTDLNGAIRWSGSGTELRELRGRMEVDLRASRVGDIGIRSAEIRGRARSDAFEIERSQILTTNSVLSFGGEVSRTGAFGGDVVGDIPALSEFRSLTPLDALDGRVHVEGNISGTLNEFRADGSLSVDDGIVDVASYKNARLHGWLERSGDDYRAAATGTLDSIDVQGEGIDSLLLAVRYENDLLQIENLTAWREEWIFAAKGEATIDDSVRILDLGDVTLSRGDSVLIQPSGFRLWRVGSKIGIDPIKLALGNGFVKLAGSREADGTLSATLECDSCNLAFIRQRYEIPEEVLHSVTLDATFRGTTDNPTGSASFLIIPPDSGNIPFSRLHGSVRFADDAVTVDSVQLDASEGSGRIKVSGDVPLPSANRPLDLVLDADRYQMKDLHFIHDQIEPFEGTATLNARIFGTLERTEAELTFQVDETRWYDFPMGTVVADSVRIWPDSLSAVLKLDHEWGQGNRLFWHHPVRFALIDGELDFLDTGRFESHLYVPNGDLGIAANLTDLVEESGGDFSLEARLLGDRADPQMDGLIQVRNGYLLPAKLAGFFEQINGRVLLDQDYLTIVSASTRNEDHGQMHLWGRVDLEGLSVTGYDLGANTKDYAILLADGIGGRFTGEYRIQSRLSSFGEPVPHITGRARASEVFLESEFEEAQPGIPTIFDPTTRPLWTADLFVRAPGNIVVRNSVLDAEFEGEVQLTKSEEGFGGVGELDLRRGSYWVYNNQFRMIDGKLTFADPNDLRNVDLNVTARTDVLGERIEVAVTGKPDTLVVTPTSESGLSQGEIFTMLSLRSGPQDSGLNRGQVLTSWATSLASRFSREMTRGLGNVGTLEIGADEDLPEIRYGNYFSNDFYLGFSQKIGQTDHLTKEQGPYQENLPIPDRQVRVEYRLRRFLVLESQAGTFRDGNRFFNVDLKYRVQY